MIENEVKYVLKLSSYEVAVSKLPSAILSSIHQGYDSKGARVRKEKYAQTTKFTFNYKFSLGNIVEEFEMNISAEEFERCYPLCTSKLEKRRYKIRDQYQNTWDIDFFFENSSLYFAMAECELFDVNEDKPKKLLPFVADNLLYCVPRNEFKKYSSHKISNAEYAKNQLTKLQNGIK